MYVKKGYAKKSRHGLWKDDEASYSAVHTWLIKNYGKADLCEEKTCKGKSKNFEWALIHGKEYTHNRKNFRKLCKSCHRKYDFTNETRELIVQHHGTRIHWFCTIQNCKRRHLAKGYCSFHYNLIYRKKKTT
jgi:hypothetical protein